VKSPTRKLARDYGATILVAVVVALLIRFFLFEAYRIPSQAMRPTLEPGDTIFVQKWPFGMRLPWRDEPIRKGRTPFHGEVVVFASQEKPKIHYIKRVIGLPGDTVEMKKGQISLNGEPLTVGSPRQSSCGQERLGSSAGSIRYSVCWEPPLIDDFGPEKVPEGHVFVVGDYRSQSISDRKQKTWGMVPISSLKGKATWIWLSIRPNETGASSLFPQFRFDRMFRRIQ
jgi:signal peptidase I